MQILWKGDRIHRVFFVAVVPRIIEQHKVSQLLSVPTAFRVIRRVDPEIKCGRKHSIKSLRTIFIAGELCDLETKNWMEKIFKVPVLNHWWQTETGSAITATCTGFNESLHPPNLTTGLPYFGYDSKSRDSYGPNCAPTNHFLFS